MYLKDLKLDETLILECIEETKDPISDRNAFMKKLMLGRLIALGDKSDKEFNKYLDDLNHKIDTDTLSILEMSRIIKKLSVVSKKLYRSEVVLLNKLDKESKK